LDLDLTGRLVVREAMSSPVITVHENQSVVSTAELMSKQRIGAVIIIDNDDNPVGILTERDLVYRILAKDLTPRDTPVKDVMSTPLRTVDPETTLEEAMKIMDKHNIRRLGVNYKNKLEGIITERDILRLIPTILEISRERSWINGGNSPRGPSLVGYCSQCEIYSTNLRNINGDFLCEDCRLDDDNII